MPASLLSQPPLLGIPLFLLIAAAVCAIGGAALFRLRGILAGTLEYALFALPVGMGMVSLAILACGLLGFLSPVALVGGVLLAGAGSAAFLWVRRPRPEGSENSEKQVGQTPRTPLFWASSATLVVLGVLTALACLAPPGGLEWDALSYHLADPKVFLQQGRIFYLPYEHHSNFPFVLQMLYLLMLRVGSIAGAKLFHWVCGVWLALAVYAFAVRHVPQAENGKAVGLLAALLVASTPLVLWEATVAYVDLATALFTFLSLYALSLGPSNDTKHPKPLLLSAILMGFALGTKYTVLGFWGMLAVGILVWQYRRSGGKTGPTLGAGVLWGTVSLAAAAPWYVKTWLYTGNPVYPFYYQIFGGRYWSAYNAALYSADQTKFGLGKTPVDLLLGPWQATMERGIIPPDRGWIFTEYITSGFGLAPAVLALVLAAGFLLGRGKKLPTSFVPLAWFGAGVYVFWFSIMQQTRYLIPALPALALIGAYALVRAWGKAGLARYVGAALCAATALWGVKMAWQIAAPTLPVTFGQQAPADYITRSGVGMRGVFPACQWINENAPKTAKVALFDEPRGFYLNRPYLWSEPNHADGLLDWSDYQSGADLIADLKKRGYTVLLIGAQLPGTPPDKKPPKWRVLLNEALQNDTEVSLAASFPAYRVRTEQGVLQSDVKVYFIQ